MMKTQVKWDDRGQVLVQVALGLVVLLLAVGLAIDGGNVYAERRRMQNAADAGALAGARAIARGGGDADARDAAENYAIDRNGGDEAVVDIDRGAVTVDVTVTASKDVDTFLMGLAGDEFATVDVAALAVAQVFTHPGFPDIVSFDTEDGLVGIDGNVGLNASGRPLIVHSNKDLNVSGAAAEVDPAPIGSYVGTLSDHPVFDLYDVTLTQKTYIMESPLRNFDHDDVTDDGTLEDEIDRLMGLDELVFEEGHEPTSGNFLYFEADDLFPHTPPGPPPTSHELSVPNSGPGVIYIDGDIDPGGGKTLTLDAKGGLIIVNGYVNITGNQTLNFDGLLYTTGYIELGGTPGSINGGLWSEEDVWFHGNPNSFVVSDIVELPGWPIVRLIR